MCTLSYFVVDFINILLNDYYWKVPSYQNPQNRRVEYGHHLFCLFVGVCCITIHDKVCTFTKQPFLYLMYAEFSTPILMAWRYYGYDWLGVLFAIAFFACRIVYHGFMFMPVCVSICTPLVGWGFSIPYMSLNAYFFYMIVRKMIKGVMKKKVK